MKFNQMLFKVAKAPQD